MKPANQNRIAICQFLEIAGRPARSSFSAILATRSAAAALMNLYPMDAQSCALRAAEEARFTSTAGLFPAAHDQK